MAGEAPMSFRFSEEDQQILEALEKVTGLKRLGVIRLALRRLARDWEVQLSADGKEQAVRQEPTPAPPIQQAEKAPTKQRKRRQ